MSLTQANLVQAGLLSNPVFNAAIGFPVSSGSLGLNFSIVQDFLSILYRPLRKAIAHAEFEGAKLRVTAAVIDLAAQVRSQFYHVQADHQRLEFLQRVVTATAASAEAAQRLYKAGNITDLDLSREQARPARASSTGVFPAAPRPRLPARRLPTKASSTSMSFESR